MPNRPNLLFSLAALSAATLFCAYQPASIHAQSTSPNGPVNTGDYLQSQPAPIQRSATPQASGFSGYHSLPAPLAAETNTTLTAGQLLTTTGNVASAQPAPGVWVRLGQNGSVRAVALDAKTVELRVERGVANVAIHHPADDSEILIDLPGGQTSLLKDGLYTFNAATNTVRVLRGEADAYPGSKPTEKSNDKPIKVKEDHAVVFHGPQVKSISFEPYQARTDLIPSPGYGGGYGYRGEPGYAPYRPYGYGPYGDGFYGYPYGGWGYPYAWDYPYGWGYPFGWGFGFGYYGGFGRFGGFRGRR
jgi:hypothetical protein